MAHRQFHFVDRLDSPHILFPVYVVRYGKDIMDHEDDSDHVTWP
jgi:hypothetical protein